MAQEIVLLLEFLQIGGRDFADLRDTGSMTGSWGVLVRYVVRVVLQNAHLGFGCWACRVRRCGVESEGSGSVH